MVESTPASLRSLPSPRSGSPERWRTQDGDGWCMRATCHKSMIFQGTLLSNMNDILAESSAYVCTMTYTNIRFGLADHSAATTGCTGWDFFHWEMFPVSPLYPLRRVQHFILGSSHTADFPKCFLCFLYAFCTVLAGIWIWNLSFSLFHRTFPTLWVWTMFFSLRFLPFVQDCIHNIWPYCRTWRVAILCMFPWSKTVCILYTISSTLNLDPQGLRCMKIQWFSRLIVTDVDCCLRKRWLKLHQHMHYMGHYGSVYLGQKEACEGGLQAGSGSGKITSIRTFERIQTENVLARIFQTTSSRPKVQRTQISIETTGSWVPNRIATVQRIFICLHNETQY